jgi:hypothetical protein
MKRLMIASCFLCLASLSLSASLLADSAGLNFVGGQPFFNVPSGPVTGSAGAPGFSQSDWNNLYNNTGSANNLIDSSGIATSIDVTWTSTDAWQVLNGAPATQNDQLMNGYLDNTIQIAVSGITYKSYEVVVYFNGDTPTADRIYHYQIGSTSIFARDNAPFNGTFTQVPGSSNSDQGVDTPAGNFIVFTDLSGPSFTLNATPEHPEDPAGRSVINGIQIVSTPEPQTVVLLLAGLIGLLLRVTNLVEISIDKLYSLRRIQTLLFPVQSPF